MFQNAYKYKHRKNKSISTIVACLVKNGFTGNQGDNGKPA